MQISFEKNVCPGCESLGSISSRLQPFEGSLHYLFRSRPVFIPESDLLFDVDAHNTFKIKVCFSNSVSLLCLLDCLRKNMPKMTVLHTDLQTKRANKTVIGNVEKYLLSCYASPFESDYKISFVKNILL